jgi:phospholipase/lecithinase/hemolysin
MGQTGIVRALVRLIVLILLSGPAVFPVKAAFSSLYAFGDGVCTTTDNPNGGSLYYPYTYSNGRVWIQVLAQRQGLTYDASKNLSYLWHTSDILITDANQFSAPDASNALFVVWLNDADFVWDMIYIYPSLDMATWNNHINSSLANHSQAISTLYAKGARTLIMPNAVDITEVPYYAGLLLHPADRNSIRQMVVAFNTSFTAMVNQARASLPGITIIVPDFFSLLDNLLANPGSYGLVNPGIDALDDPNLTDYSLNGPGAYYVFWDYQDPTAKAHEVMADTAQQLISPVAISNLTSLNGSNRLNAANIPIGLNGFVDGRTNLVGTWTSVTNFSSTSVTQSIFVPASGQQRFYRLRFPFAWSPP